MNTFYSQQELETLGLKSYGEDVLISRKCTIIAPNRLSVGDHVRIDDFCILSGDITLGSYIHISAYVALYGANGIVMEDYTGLSPRVTVFSATDDFSGDYLIGPMLPEDKTNVIGGKVTIRRFSQIGASTTLLPDIEIGEGCAVGAMSLVKSSLESWGIYAGVPARYIKARSKKLLDLLETN